MAQKSKVIFLIIFLCFGFIFFAKGEDKMNEPFGVLEFLHWNHPWNNYHYSNLEEVEKAVNLIKQLRVTWVRLDFLWQDIEPEQGKFDFSKYDSLVEILTRNQINILGVLQYSVDWASDGCWNCPPKENALFVNYAAEVIKRYKDKIKYWEIWNEPDSEIYWSKQDGLKTYGRLLKEVYLAAKEIDPECKILNGGLANGLSSVNRLYESEAKGHFDILNLHFFASPYWQNAKKVVEAFPRSVYKIMKRSGDEDKKIWITEIGCPGVKPGLKVDNWWLGKNPSEALQARWLNEAFKALLKDKNVEKIFWAFLRDTEKHWYNGIDYFGLVRHNFSKKPAFKAYQKVIADYRKKR